MFRFPSHLCTFTGTRVMIIMSDVEIRMTRVSSNMVHSIRCHVLVLFRMT